MNSYHQENKTGAQAGEDAGYGVVGREDHLYIAGGNVN
jgi:hypothetical protein